MWKDARRMSREEIIEELEALKQVREHHEGERYGQSINKV